MYMVVKLKNIKLYRKNIIYCFFFITCVIGVQNGNLYFVGHNFNFHKNIQPLVKMEFIVP